MELFRPYMDHDDETLLTLVKNGDEAAFNVTYDRYSSDLFDSVYNG